MERNTGTSKSTKARKGRFFLTLWKTKTNSNPVSIQAGNEIRSRLLALESAFDALQATLENNGLCGLISRQTNTRFWEVFEDIENDLSNIETETDGQRNARIAENLKVAESLWGIWGNKPPETET